MQKITPHLWFDKEAKEAAGFYTSLFKDSKITDTTTLRNTPSGDTDVVSFELSGQPFMAISAGPLFKFNPSVSFQVNCRTTGEVEALWEKLLPGGKVLMPLDRYPFGDGPTALFADGSSEIFGWLQDRYGLSWQVISTGGKEIKQRITPILMFVGEACGKAEEAVRYYASVFRNARVDHVLHYGKGEEPDREGTLKYAQFALEGQEFGAMDSAHDHRFDFNEAISFIVHGDTQEEIDYYWEKLSADPKAEQCGWLRDKYGLSWQIVPSVMYEMLRDKDEQKLARVIEAFLKMKKFDIQKLREAYEGKTQTRLKAAG